MSPQIRWLKAGLLFCSPERRLIIEAQIEQLQDRESPEERPSEGCLEPPARRVDAERAVTPLASPGPAGDWRACRKALRQAGHDVQQVNGVVYVDGKQSDDPELRA